MLQMKAHSKKSRFSMKINPFATSPSYFRQTPQKLQILTSLTIHFSCKSEQYSIIYGHLKIKFPERNFLHEAKFVNFKPHAQNCSGSNWIHLTAFLLVQKKVWISTTRMATILPKNSLDEGNFDQKWDKSLKNTWYE